MWKKLLIAVSIVIVLLVIQSRNTEMDRHIKGVFGNIANPIIYNIDRVKSMVSSSVSNYIYLVDVQNENRQIREEMRLMMLENVQLRQQISANDQVRLLGFLNNSYLEYLPSKVISRNLFGFSSYYLVDKGSSDGIAINDIVVDVNGLVGKVVETYYSSSRVDSILESNTYVSVRNDRSGVLGMLHGDSKGALLVEYYDTMATPEQGDILVTSGLGGIYFSGIPVAEIEDVYPPSSGLFRSFSMNYLADLNRVDYVLIIKGE